MTVSQAAHSRYDELMDIIRRLIASLARKKDMQAKGRSAAPSDASPEVPPDTDNRAGAQHGRGMLPGDPMQPWRRYAISAIAGATTLDQLRPLVVDRDGHIREAAVDACARYALSGALPLLVERLNDWVPQVRAAAQRALTARIPLASPSELLATLPHVYRLALASRAQHAHWIASFERTVLMRVDPADLLQAVRQGEVRVARAAFRLLAGSGTATPAALFEAVLEARPDIVLATQAFDHVDAAGTLLDEALLVRALGMRVPALRARVLQALIARGRTEHVQDALFASHARVRAVAMAWLGTQGADVGRLYLEKLRTPGAPAALVAVCLAGLGLLRSHACLDEVLTWLDDGHASVRAAAATAWLQLAPDAKDAIAARMLDDPSPRLRKFALELVRKHGAYVPFAHARTVLLRHGDDKRLLAFAALDPWNWLETILSLAAGPQADPARRLWLQSEFEAWLGRSGSVYNRPDAAQRARIDALLRGEACQALTDRQSWGAGLVQILEPFGFTLR